MSTSKKFSVRKRFQSFFFAFKGIKTLLKQEHNARIQFAAFFVAMALGTFFKIALTEWIALIMVSGLVIIAELFNSAIERLADFVEPKWNAKIGVIKDYGAAAVLIAAMVAIIVGGIIFIPKIIAVMWV